MMLAATNAIETWTPPLYLAGLLGLGILAQWIAWRMRLPAIVLLLSFGFALGQLTSVDQFLPDELLFPVVSLSVGIILFEGGLSLRFKDVRETGRVVLRLVTVGLALTWGISAYAAWLILDFSPRMAVLIAALLTVSGPTVIVPLLRHVRPTHKIGSIIKWEGIVNDPIGAVLAALVFEFVAGEQLQGALQHSLIGMGTTIFVGLAIGLLAAVLLLQLLKRFMVPDYLQNPVVLATVLIVFALSNLLQHEAGLITVTVLGVILANQKRVSIRHIVEFKENLRVLLIATLFIVLAARIDISDAALEKMNWTGAEALWRSVAFLLVLVFIVRPLAAMVSTVGCGLEFRDRVLLSWIHPRGIVAAAVSSVFAIELAGMPNLNEATAAQAHQFVLVTFVVIAGTVSIYGLTLAPLAQRLGLASQNPQGILFAGASQFIRELALTLKKEGFTTLLVDTNYGNITVARMSGLPAVYASIASEFAREEIDLADIGRLLAMTPNDQVNTLAVLEFIENFGRAEVYQLAPPEAPNQRQEVVSTERQGRILFRADANSNTLEDRFAAGAVFKKTTLTESFQFKDFLAEHGPEALVLFVVERDKKLRVVTADEELAFKPGQKIVALVDPPAKGDSEPPGETSTSADQNAGE